MSERSFSRIVIVGGGKMGEAILGGLLRSQEGIAVSFTPESFLVVDPGERRRCFLEDTYQVACVSSVSEVSETYDVVILAVKPQVMKSVVTQIASLNTFAGANAAPLYVSIAAGLSIASFESWLPQGARVVRTMPNTPLLVGKGVVALAQGAEATKDDINLVEQLFNCLGSAYLVNEDDIDAVGALSGSGPAYVAAFIEALRDGAVDQGLDFNLAEALALETVWGTVSLIKEREQGIAKTREAVCSPNGTTLAALAAFDEAGFAQACKAGVAAAVKRSKELAAC